MAAMRTVEVQLGAAPAAAGDRSYPIHIGAGLLDRVGEFLAPLAPSSIAIVTDPTVGALYADRVEASCAALLPVRDPRLSESLRFHQE